MYIHTFLHGPKNRLALREGSQEDPFYIFYYVCGHIESGKKKLPTLSRKFRELELEGRAAKGVRRCRGVLPNWEREKSGDSGVKGIGWHQDTHSLTTIVRQEEGGERHQTNTSVDRGLTDDQFWVLLIGYLVTCVSD